MKRREFLQRTAVAAAVCAVPMIASARKARDVITVDDLLALQKTLQAQEVSGPFYAVVTPTQMHDLLLQTNTVHRWEGITFVESGHVRPDD